MSRKAYLLLLIMLNACIAQDVTPRAPAEPAFATTGGFSSQSSVAQPTLQPVCNCVLRFDHITIEQGLSQSTVHAMLQDSRGFLWIGTEDGLNRYDGYKFTIFKPDPDSPTSISDRRITALAEDKQGYIWVGTGLGGLNRYDPTNHKFTHFQHDEKNPASLVSNRILSLYADGQNRLWIGTKNGLDVLNIATGRFTHYTYELGNPNSLSSKYITVIFQSKNGEFWFGTSDGGLNRFDAALGLFKSYRYNPADSTSISSNQVTSIAQDWNGTLWIGTPNGLNKLSNKNEIFTRFQVNPTRPNSISSNMIQSVYVDSTNNIWIGTEKGLERMNISNNRFTQYIHDPSYSQSLSHNSVISIMEDRGGVLWFGTANGLNKYDRERDKFAYYRNETNNPNSLSDNIIYSLHPDKLGNIWVGTGGGGLNRFNPQTRTITHYEWDPKNPNGIASNTVLAIAEDQQGNFWIGTSNGLDHFNRKDNLFTHYRRDPARIDTTLSSNLVYSLLNDSADNLWIGTSAGLDYLETKTQSFTHYRPDPINSNSLSGSAVSALYEDTQGNIWAGTMESGLNRFNKDEQTFTQYRYNQNDKLSISSDSILAIYQDSQGRLWVGTGGGGLNLYHPETDTFTYFLEKDGLPNSVIYGIVEDNDQNLWLSTNYGISRFSPDMGSFLNFDSRDGLQSNEFNMGAYAKGSRGEIYFGGINGLTIFRPSNINKNQRIPDISITSITSDGQPVQLKSSVETLQEITLKWPNNSLEFEFAALSFNQPNKNQYAYMLDEFENNWNYIGTKRDGRYTNLPGGNYTLLLKASNADGVWNEVPIHLNVTVVPPFWQTNWFRVFLVLVVGTAILTAYRLRLDSIHKRNRELEIVVEQRTGELKKRNNEIEALYEADEKILRNVSINQVFQTLVHVAVEILQADKSVVLTWDADKEGVVPRISKGFQPETLSILKFKAGEGKIGEALKNGKTVIIHEFMPGELQQDLRDAINNEGIRSFVNIPIAIDNKILGIFNVSFTRPDAITENTVRLFTALAQRASLSIANMELFEQTKDLAVMEERNRLARDLHDSAKQKAFAALAQIGTVRGTMSKNNGGFDDTHINEAENLVHDVIQELTFLIQEIYPIALQEKGLLTTLREYIYEWENQNDVKVTLSVQNDRRLPLEVEQAIYRVTQEILANAARHSTATQVNISIVYQPHSLQVSIHDDGCGFDTDKKSKGMGLRSMRERMASIRGTIQIESAPGLGTHITLQAPIK